MLKIGSVARIGSKAVRGRKVKKELVDLSVVLVEPDYNHTPVLWTVRVCITGKIIALYEDEIKEV